MKAYSRRRNKQPKARNNGRNINTTSSKAWEEEEGKLSHIRLATETARRRKYQVKGREEGKNEGKTITSNQTRKEGKREATKVGRREKRRQ